MFRVPTLRTQRFTQLFRMMSIVTTSTARRLAWAAVLLAAAAVRLPTAIAARPYINYVDEGHVLHHAVHLLVHRTWDPEYYMYPTLPTYAVAAATWAWSPAYKAAHGQPLRHGLSAAPFRYYDVLEPWELILAGRLVNLALGLGIVVLTGLLVQRLAGQAAGLFAAWLAALAPALVIRGASVSVDPYAAFFVLAALFFAEKVREGLREGPRPRLYAALAGAMVGLAAVSKYPGALAGLPVALAVLYAGGPWKERLRRLLLAGASAVLAAVLAMPALVLRTAEVLRTLREVSAIYIHQQAGSYWDQAVHRAEWDQPLHHPELGIVFMLLTAAGLLLGLQERRWTRSVQGWLLFAAALGLLLSPYRFRALRNLLPLIPLACALVALVYARLREPAPRRLRLGLDLAAALLPLLLWTPALRDYLRYQLTLEDTREKAIAWLAQHTGPDDRILFLEEMAFLPSRIGTLGTRGEIRPWKEVVNLIEKRRARYVVLGNLPLPDGRPRIRPSLRPVILHRYQIAARFGHDPTFIVPGAHKGNHQTIYILKRVPRRGGSPPASRR